MKLEVIDVGKTYQTEYRKVEALKSVSLSLEEGCFCCILGKSGSGKSTLLNICAGILSATTGRVLLDGVDYSQCNDRQLSFLRNDKIGYVMQGYALLPNLTVRENVKFPHMIYKRPGGIEDYADRLLQIVGMGDMADRYPAELSGGEIRRVEIARALINRPALVIADEPTGDLDKINSADIMELFREINRQGTSILMVSHDLETTTYCKELFTMEDGVLYPGDRISCMVGKQ